MVNTNRPVISVVIPTYNVTRYIPDALNSLLCQQFRDFETIVVNDGCPDTDRLEQALKPFRHQIRYLRQPHSGVAKARNTAVLHAKGDFIVNLDPDDWFEPTCLESQLAAITATPGLDLVYANPRFVGGGPNVGKCMMDIYPTEEPVTFAGIMDGRCGTSNPGSIIRRSRLIGIGLYDESLRAWEDVDVILRILKANPAGAVSFNRAPVVNYRQHSASLTRKPDNMEYFLRVIDKCAATLPLSADERSALARRRELVEFAVILNRGKEHFKNRDWQAAIPHLAYCARRKPALKLCTALLAAGVFHALRLPQQRYASATTGFANSPNPSMRTTI